MGRQASCGHRCRRRRHGTDGDEDVKAKRRRRNLKDGEEQEAVAAIQCLPPEMVVHIASFLTLPDLLRLGQTCRYLHEVCESEAAWRHLCSPLPAATASAQPCKRAAILNYTKGLYFWDLGRRQQQIKMVSILSPQPTGYRKLVPARKHIFLLDYTGTLFLLCNYGCRARHCQTLSSGVKDVTADHREAPTNIYVLTGQEHCDTLEVYTAADAQCIHRSSLPASIRFRQLVVTNTEATCTLLLLTEEGQVYKLRRGVDPVALHPLGLCQPVRDMVDGHGAVAFLTEMGGISLLSRSSGHPACPMPIPLPRQIKVVSCSVGYKHLGLVDDQGRVYMQGKNRYGQLGTGDRLDRTEVTQVPCPPYPRFILCGLNYSLVLTQDRTLLGCGCRVRRRLPGFPCGSANFVQLCVTIPRWVSGLSAAPHCLLLSCGHDIEGPRLYPWEQGRKQQR